MSEILVEVENVSKKYCRTLKRSLWYGIQDVFGEVFIRGEDKKELRNAEFWALQDISFRLCRGECLGLLGPNGAGKSTLLKLINGLIKPDRGRITIRGRLGALIELGTGFNPILTGRENIYNNGSVLGFSKNEIDNKLERIIEFSELKEFMDMPLQNYSSGMKVRLGFAVASHLNPDILIIDEVLAVGDVGFRAKCYNRIAEIMTDTAVILVSHSISHVDRYCNNLVLLANGQVTAHTDGKIGSAKGDVIDKYYSLFENESPQIINNKNCQLIKFEVLKSDDSPITTVDYGDYVKMSISAKVDSNIDYPVIHIAFLNRELQVVAYCRSENRTIKTNNGVFSVIVDIGPMIFNRGQYKISLIVFDENELHCVLWCNAFRNFEAEGTMSRYGGAAINFAGKWTQQR